MDLSTLHYLTEVEPSFAENSVSGGHADSINTTLHMTSEKLGRAMLTRAFEIAESMEHGGMIEELENIVMLEGEPITDESYGDAKDREGLVYDEFDIGVKAIAVIEEQTGHRFTWGCPEDEGGIQ